MLYTVLAYLIWGSFAAFFPLLKPAAPLEILAHRVVWTAVFMLILIVATKAIRELRAADRRTWLSIGAASIIIAVNWLLYVIAVNSGHVSDAAFGYFINPLVNGLLGMGFLGERLRNLQKISVTIAACAVIMLTIASGQPPLLGLGLAFSFGFYGLIKKRVNVSAAASLAAETMVLFPIALLYLVFLTTQHHSTFTGFGAGHTALLISSGLVTAVPLLLFGLGAKLIPLSTVGMLQYMTPTMQMLWAVFVVDEQLTPIRWVGFVIIWISVAIYLTDIVVARRSTA